MKICLVSDYLPGYHDNWGGGEKAAISIAKLLAEKKDHEVVVVTKKTNKELKDSFKHYSLRTTEDLLGKKLGLYYLRFKSIWLPFDLITYFSALKLFKKIKPDVINLQNFRELSFSVMQAAKKLNIPVVYSVYDYWLFCPKIDLATEKEICRNSNNCFKCIGAERFGLIKKLLVPLRKKMFNQMKKQFDAVITLSENSKELVIKEGLQKRKVSVVPLPFSDLKVDLKRKVNPNMIFFLGWIHHRKGLKILMQAVASLISKYPKIKLVAIGTPADKQYEADLIKISSKHKENIEFIIGKQPFEKIKELMAKAGMIVIPEQWENMSPVLLIESMFNAKPVIASKVGGIPSFIKEGRSGLLFKHDSLKDLADKIEFYLKNPDKASIMGFSARAEALKIFDPKKINNKLINVYRKIIK